MILNRYFASHAFETLRDARLKVARVTSFNDPFECMFRLGGEMTLAKAKELLRVRMKSPRFIARVMSTNRDLKTTEAARRFMKKTRAEAAADLVTDFPNWKERGWKEREALMDEYLRVVSFSGADAKSIDEILMWSHYAGHHRGVRIAFEFPDEIRIPFIIGPIKYREHRVELDMSIDAEDPSIKEALIESTQTKSTAWSYEREYRLVTDPIFCVKEKTASNPPLEFIKFDKSWVRRVDFGARFKTSERGAILDLVKTVYPHVTCFQSVYHKTDYALEYEKV